MPSDELSDEIEALNSIYGDGTLSPSTSSDAVDVYVLVLPAEDTDGGAASSDLAARAALRLYIPPSYPSSEPPSVLATHSAGAHAKPGAAAHALTLFRAALAETYTPGEVCLFDAIEDFSQRMQASAPDAAAPASRTPSPSRSRATSPGAAGASATCTDTQAPPPWTLSDPLTELKSTFLARAAAVTSPAQANAYVAHLLATDKKARAATHNITAWRVRGPRGASFQDCDDDGESAAGGRVLKLLQMMDVWDVMVVVTRWYGGQKLGPRRFAVINMVARQAVVRLVGEAAGGGGGGKGGKK
ncbi:hypothetical protein VD0004_g7931 [Verticillium dahliae]|uniref:Uncharacterized protein n=1 Tax=Verticillium dahliae TaxID=27337 RepID=A0A366P787_VERDA|nr:hypothetical protein VD0004_g7931 [Verticillium dahliae]PNH72863.1 hypothetical protein VD0001_g4696 [Verticillium dahliae]RBQ88492.1 hypothetical protein VDGD_01347 [Verticillium dahliae]RXG44954.1 hypothetical protein VDGE_01347 [Verticillium dahliae]